MNQEYEFNKFVNCFIESRRRNIKPDYRDYISSVLKGLEKLYKLRISNGSHKVIAKSDLHSEVFALVDFINNLNPHHIRFFARLQMEENEEYQVVYNEIQELNRRFIELRALYIDKIVSLLKLIYGDDLINKKSELVFSSKDLSSIGVDDSKQVQS